MSPTRSSSDQPRDGSNPLGGRRNSLSFLFPLPVPGVGAEAGASPDSGRANRRESIISLISERLPDVVPLPSSFVPTAPIVQEILSRDLAECSSATEPSTPESLSSESESDVDVDVSITGGDEDGEGCGDEPGPFPHLHDDINDGDEGEGEEEEEDDDDDNHSCHHHHHHHRRHTRHSDPADAKLAFHPNGVAFGCGFSTVSIQGLDRPVANPREMAESLSAEVGLLRDNGLLPPASRHRSSSIISAVVPESLRKHIPSSIAGITGIAGIASADRRGDDHRDHHPSQDYSVATAVAAGEADETSPLLRLQQPHSRRAYVFGDDGCDTDDLSEGQISPCTPAPEEVHKRWEQAVAEQRIKTTARREAVTLVRYAMPLIATFLLHYSVTVGSVLAVGRLGMVELAAVNLATMTASITCYVPVQGLATCLDTLCAQAYGSGHIHLVGLQAQRMTFFLCILMVPIAVLWFFSEPILSSLVPSEDPSGNTAIPAALYLRVLIFGMPGVAAFEAGKRFVQAQGLFHATTCVLLVGAPTSFLLNWLFVFRFGWGFAGAAGAMAVTQNLLPVLLALYVFFIEGRQCWRGFTWKAFSNWGPMLRLALPGMIMIEAQFSVLEILTVAAGRLGTAQLAAQSVLVTVTSTSFNVPFPLAIATSTRVANLIGASLGDAAQTTTKVAVVAATIVGLINATLLFTLRTALPSVFTSDAEVISIASKAMLVCAAMQIFDALAAVSHGILRGVGRQAVGGYANLFSYYAVALPVALSTAFSLGWGLSGLWFGLTAGLAVVSALELLYLYNSDWDSAVAQAAERMRSEEGGLVEPKNAGILA